MKVDGRNAGNRIHAKALGMRGELAAFMGVVARHMGDNGALALDLRHHGIQNLHALLLFQIDALAGGTAHIQATDALVYKVTSQFARALHAHAAVVLIAGVKRGNNALIFFQVESHWDNPLSLMDEANLSP